MKRDKYDEMWEEMQREEWNRGADHAWEMIGLAVGLGLLLAGSVLWWLLETYVNYNVGKALSE